jgi:hypothetical protein
MGAVCAADASGEELCLVPFGGECDLEADDPFCMGAAECMAYTETVDGEEVTVGRCYVPRGAVCNPDAEMAECAPPLTCAELDDGTFQCHPPVLVRGRVFDSGTEAGIVGAHVLGLDDRPIAITDIAESQAAGEGVEAGDYVLEIPVVRTSDGTPTELAFTLRSSADGYQTFPSGIRTALPIMVSSAVEMENEWTISGTIADIALIPLEDQTAPRISISGTVLAADQSGGVLVVAENDTAGYSAISARDGAYTIFNVAPGDYTIRGFVAGLQFTPVTATAADVDLTGQDLALSEAPLNSLSGMLEFANAPEFTMTSVVLAVRSTFSETFGRGDVPAGLRDPREGPPNVTAASGFTITDIPDGTYVILAAFENDGGVRDPDTNIGGTATLTVTLPQDGVNDVTLTDSFKVTQALEVFSPGATGPEAVTEPPLISWEDDSSEVYHQLQVFDAYGNVVWEVPMITGPAGSAPVTRMYEGPLESGMYYQFRATAWREPGGTPAPTSRTEDLLGVFYVP